MNRLVKTVLALVLIIVVIQAIIVLYQAVYGVYKYCFMHELNLLERYGKNTYVVITGAGSGQGKLYALNFAKRGFHLILMGSERCFTTQQEIARLYPASAVRVIVVDFGKGEETLMAIEHLFHLMSVDQLDVSVLVNNVGRRTASRPSHHLSDLNVVQTINAGTLPQVMLTNRFITYFDSRRDYSAIIFVTAQCVHPNFGLGIGLDNMISVPYLSVYEATNTFGCFHAHNTIEEYHNSPDCSQDNRIDMLNVMPGGTITENTEPFMKQVPFSVPQEELVNNVFKMLGQVNGTTSAHWKHALALYLVNVIPWKKREYLEKTGNLIAKHYMKN